jgi:hypothetical protein
MIESSQSHRPILDRPAHAAGATAFVLALSCGIVGLTAYSERAIFPQDSEENRPLAADSNLALDTTRSTPTTRSRATTLAPGGRQPIISRGTKPPERATRISLVGSTSLAKPPAARRGRNLTHRSSVT